VPQVPSLSYTLTTQPSHVLHGTCRGEAPPALAWHTWHAARQVPMQRQSDPLGTLCGWLSSWCVPLAVASTDCFDTALIGRNFQELTDGDQISPDFISLDAIRELAAAFIL